MQPGADQVFRISKAALRRRHFNALLGIAFAVALCFLVLYGNSVDSDTYNDTLLFSVVVFVFLFCLFNLVGHFRFILNSRKHHVEVGEDRITFFTGSETSVLMLNEVVIAEQQSRLREGPSLMMQLKNRRIVRLVGYERQEALTEMVTRRIALLDEMGSE